VTKSVTVPSSARRAGSFCDLLWLLLIILYVCVCKYTAKAPKNRNFQSCCPDSIKPAPAPAFCSGHNSACAYALIAIRGQKRGCTPIFAGLKRQWLTLRIRDVF